MPTRKIALLLILSGLLLSPGVRAEEVTAPAKPWFMPHLTTDADPLCASLLTEVRKQFMTKVEWEAHDQLQLKFGAYRPVLQTGRGGVEDDASIQSDPSDWRKLIFSLPDGGRSFVFIDHFIRCGGGCNTDLLIVLDRPHDPRDYKYAARRETSEANSWTVFNLGNNGGHLAVGLVADHIEAYRIASPEKFRLSCRIAIAPEKQDWSDEQEQRTMKAVEALSAASKQLSRGGAYCGSAATSFRWENSIEHSLRQAVYRPWVMLTRDVGSSANSWGDYEQIAAQLEEWSLGGLSEHDAFQRYQEQFASTEGALADFYRTKFGWPKEQALETSHKTLRYAISGGFGFYLYDPYTGPEEIALRKAILDKRPMSEIEAIKIDVSHLDTLLDISVAYPEALNYLLKRGLDPNHSNAFGKTPLMYAAQYNQAASVDLLLKAGADPNAYTTEPPDKCGYSLETTNMTPLHYAARYGSATIIRRLTEAGALTFVKSHHPKRHDETPLDWFHRYTNAEPGAEQNPSIAHSEIGTAEALLQPPPTEKLAQIAKAKVLEAEALYAGGDSEAAYQAMSVALAAQPDNEKVIADLPLIALKTGRLGIAAEASVDAAKKLASPALQATAWFNLGLVCEQTTKHVLFYNGNPYCQGDRIAPFVRAWKRAPTPSRAAKLVQLLQQNAPDMCVLERPGGLPRRYRVVFDFGFFDGVYRHSQRFYVLHGTGDTIDPTSIRWSVQFAARKGEPASPPQIMSPQPVDRLDLGANALTILESPYFNSNTLTIEGAPCRPPH